MYNYEIGYISYEEAPLIMLQCEKLYSEEEFRNLCAKITAELYRNRKTLFKERYDFEPSELFDNYDPKGKFEDLIFDVIDVLIKNYSFSMVKSVAKFQPFGWAYFIPKDDWESDTKGDKDLQAIRNLL